MITKAPYTIPSTTRRATPNEAATVEVIDIRTPRGVPGTLTGVPTEADGDTIVHLYSARCVHDFCVVPTVWVTRRTPDPRTTS